jgi:hypothetical protein
MTTTCPACNKTVDPLRSRFVGVLHGKVVAYCSAECAARTQPAPLAAPPTVVTAMASPVAGAPVRVPAPSTDVAARTTPPAPPAPPGRPAASAAPAAPVIDLLGGPPRPLTPAPGVPIDPRSAGVLDSGPVIEILHEPASGVVTSARDERTEPRAKHPDEIPIAEFWSADQDRSDAVRAAGDPGSGPVTPRGDGSRASPASGTAAQRPHVAPPVEQAHDQPDDDDDVGFEPPRKSRVPILILILILVGTGGYLAYEYYLKGNLAAATRVTPAPAARLLPRDPAGAPREVGPAAAPRSAAPGARAVDIEAALAQARTTLQADLAATSPRVQRIAAEALARTQDPAARDVLAAQLGLPAAPDVQRADSAAPRVRETSDIARLDLAYSLARGGDPRGAQALAGALGSSRAEVRDEAARLFALLGDVRAVPHLTDLLAVSQRRLGAAEHLAHLAEPHAIKVLEQIRNDAKASADDRARATIALGIARHADVAPALRDMLGDPHENAFVAAALAELKDGAARPVLERQLESPALRVRAARALRRLDPTLDPKPALARLVEVLKTGRDIDQVQAAEAILLLAGPAAWSTYD